MKTIGLLLVAAGFESVFGECVGGWHGTNCDQRSLVMKVTSGVSCEDSGLRTIIGGPDLCAEAMISYSANRPHKPGNPTVMLYGDAGCDIGKVDLLDYGFCNGGSSSKPRGCTDKSGTAYHNERTTLVAPCSTTYACLCYNDKPKFLKITSGLCTDYGYELLTPAEVRHS